MRIIIVMILFFNCINSKAQELTYAYVDSSTYSDFILENKGELRKIGRKAINNGVDFYYLRMRLGISYYNEKNYNKSLIHFERAYEMNPADTVVQEYYYYSLLFVQRYEDAHDLAESFSDNMQQSVNHVTYRSVDVVSTFRSFSINVGAGLTDNVADAEEKDFKEDAFYSETNLQGYRYFSGLSFKNQISNRLSFKTVFNVYNTNSIGIVQSNILDSTELREYSQMNYQCNVLVRYALPGNFIVGCSGGYFQEESTFLTTEPDLSNFVLNFNEIKHQHNAFTVSLFGYKRLRNFLFGITTSYGNLADSLQLQGDVHLTYYPFGNSFLYGSGQFTWMYNGNSNQQVYRLKIGGRITTWLWYGLSAGYGDFTNLISINGLATYNTVDPIWLNTGANLEFIFGKFHLIPHYQLQIKSTSYDQYFDLNNIETITRNYNNHIINLKLKWTF